MTRFSDEQLRHLHYYAMVAGDLSFLTSRQRLQRNMSYQSFCFLIFCLYMGFLLLMYTKAASDNPVRFHKLIDYTFIVLYILHS